MSTFTTTTGVGTTGVGTIMVMEPIGITDGIGI
jgi:hypothetical protein